MKKPIAKKTTGMVLGKFLPLHRGHELLLRFAAGFVDQLYVVIDWNDTIPMETRRRWVQETVPQAVVLCLTHYHPQSPDERADFWDVWRDSLLSVLPEKPDYVVASEAYGFKLADVLGAEFIPFDMKRENAPTSGTAVRGNLYARWDDLSEAAKRDYLVPVCIFGPESTGKSTLAQQLAAHYQTVCVPEYARFYIETKGRDLTADDMLPIAKGQIALEQAMMPHARRFLFCDTDPLATTIWSRWLFNSQSDELDKLAAHKTYPLYLLTDADLPWREDTVRYFEGRGQEFLEDCKKTLERHGRPYALISGAGDQRLQNAIAEIEARIPDLFKI